MKRPTIALTLAALLALLTVPSAAIGAPRGTEHFGARLKDTACTHSGAFYDHGSVDSTAKAIERERNGTNYIVLKGSFQRRDNGAWNTLTRQSFQSPSFPDDASSHTHIQPWAWAVRDEDLGAVFRWKIQFQFWDKRPGKDVKIAEKVKLTDPCAT